MGIDESKVKWDSAVSIDESKIKWDDPKAIDESKVQWDDNGDWLSKAKESANDIARGVGHFATLPSRLMEEALNTEPTKMVGSALDAVGANADRVNSMLAQAIRPAYRSFTGGDNTVDKYIKDVQDRIKSYEQKNTETVYKDGQKEEIIKPSYEASSMLTHPLNAVFPSLGKAETLLGAVGHGAGIGTGISAFDSIADNKDMTLKDTVASAGTLAAINAITHGLGKIKTPDTIKEDTQTPTDFDAQSYLDSTKASKASYELGLNDNPNYKTMEEIKAYIAENDKGGQAQADLFEQQMNLWAKAENLRRAEEGREPVTAEQMANDFILKYEAQPKEVVNENVATDNLQNHPRFQELMDMRRDVSSKDTRYSQTLAQPRGTDADGNWYGASYDRNFNADFELTKADVKAIESGKATPEQITKLRNDLGRLENDPMYKQAPMDANELLAANGELFSKAYHGTPHEVDRFSTDKIGTGEGAQAYGYGLYFADSKSVAEWYRDTLKPYGHDNFIIDGKAYDRNDLTTAEVYAIRDILKDGYEQALETNEKWVKSKTNPKDIDLATLDAIKRLKGLSIKENKGNLYRVDLKPKEEEYLLWDKPLDEQSLHVKEALQKELDIYRKSEGAKGAYVNNSSGEKLYKEFIYTYGSDKKASERLNELGIKGIKYEDGNSRSIDVNKNHNYVIFKNEDVEITGANGKMFDGTPDELFQNKENIKGSYTIDQKLIQIFKDSDFSTINHELGHRFLFTLNARERAIAEQVFGVKDGNWKVENHEAFADAYARYIADGRVQHEGLRAIFEKFKEFTKKILSDLQANNGGKLPPMSKDAKEFFKAMLGDEGARAELLKKMEGKEAIEGRTKTLAVFNPTQIKSIHNKGTFDENNPNILYQRTDLSVGDETLMESVQRKVQDKFLRVKKLIEAKANINAIADKLNPYLAEELYHGRVQNRLDQFQKDYVEPIIKKISSSKVTIDQVDEYLHARHAIERNRKMEELNGIKDGSGMSDAEAVRILARYANNTDMLDIAKMVYAMNKDRLKLIYKEGLESADFIKTIDGTYNNYVPLKRVMDSDGNYMSTGKGFDIKGKELKRAHGSNREVESPLLNSILAFNETIIRAEKNEVGKAMINFAEAYPDANLYEVNSLKHVPQYDSNGDVISMNPKYQLANNVLHVKIDGKVKEIVFKDPLLARAFKNLSSEQMDAVMRGAHKLIRYYASINTQYNPEFVISNFERDLQTAMINLPEEVKGSRAIILRDVFSAMNGIHKAIYERTPNEWSKLYAEMKAEGGTTGWIEQYNVPDMKKSTEILIRKYEGEVMPKEAFKAVLDHIDNINTVIENASRLVVYKMAKESGLSNKRSASIAKNLTVNFNRKGEMGKTLNLMYMFFNASIQGTTRTLQAIKHSKTVQGIVGGIIASSTALTLYNMSQNEEAYSLIPQYEKDTNLIFMNEDGTYKKVKVPYGYNVFKSMGDIMAESYNGDLKPEKMPSRILGVAVNAFSPIGTAPTLGQMLTPTIARPAVDLAVNKNFAGNPIQPEKSGFGASSPDSYNYFNSVNPIAKSIAQEANKLTGGNMYKSGMADVSPETIEYLFETATGGVGKFFNRVYKTASGNAETNDIPFVRNFIGETTDKSKQSKVYDIYKRSGEEIIDQKELDRFVKFGRECVSNGSIEPDRFISMVTTIASNQAKLKWADRNDIQSKDDVLNSPSIMMDALQSGVPKSEILSIAKKKKKEDEALLKR